MACTGAELAGLASQTGAISMVFSFVTVPISILPPVAVLPWRSQTIQPAARACAESSSTAQTIAGVAQHLL